MYVNMYRHITIHMTHEQCVYIGRNNYLNNLRYVNGIWEHTIDHHSRLLLQYMACLTPPEHK